jgi:CheY-like chemotaxis protein
VTHDGEAADFRVETEATTPSSSISGFPASTASRSCALAARRQDDARAPPDGARVVAREGSGIDAGADDYVAKPFHIEEVLAACAR